MEKHSIDRLLAGLPESKPSREQEDALAATTGEQRAAALESLVMGSMRDAFFYVRQCARGRMPDDDIYSLCYRALSHSAVNFRPNRKSYFAFSKPYLRGQLMREFKKQFAVRRGAMISIQSPDMIAAAENDGWEAGAGALQDVSVAPEFDAMQLRERIHLLAPLMARLNAAQREVLNLRYIDGLTLEEIGKRRKVTRERIRQIEAAALRKLRRALECRKQENE